VIHHIKTWLIRKIFGSIYRPGHFYSAVPSLEDISMSNALSERKNDVPGVDLAVPAQQELLLAFNEFRDGYIWGEKQRDGLRYFSDNGFFNAFDGYVLYSMMRKFRPRKIIEIGSGFSSALMLDVNEKVFNQEIELTFIDPFMDRLNDLLKDTDQSLVKVTKLQSKVQRDDMSVFQQLEANDILFIDSSHVSKAGSDVNFEFFEILPLLKPGVIIHIHDIFYPFEYPKPWLDSGIFWNEAYLLRAFLMNNNQYSCLLFNHYWNGKQMQGYGTITNGGSFWMRKN